MPAVNPVSSSNPFLTLESPPPRQQDSLADELLLELESLDLGGDDGEDSPQTSCQGSSPSLLQALGSLLGLGKQERPSEQDILGGGSRDQVPSTFGPGQHGFPFGVEN